MTYSPSHASEKMSVKDTVKRFIDDRFLMGTGFKDIGDDDSFLENGIIDSTGVLELVTFTEETFGIHIEDEDLTPENLDSLEKITLFINDKTKAMYSTSTLN